MARRGVPVRTGWVRRLPSLNEFFVHHEGVRRANDVVPEPSGMPGRRA